MERSSLLKRLTATNDNAKPLDPVLNGWAHDPDWEYTRVAPGWDLLRPFVRFEGRWRAALRKWYDEVHHRPEHMCKKDEHGETEAARAMEEDMAAPVFAQGPLGKSKA